MSKNLFNISTYKLYSVSNFHVYVPRAPHNRNPACRAQNPSLIGDDRKSSQRQTARLASSLVKEGYMHGISSLVSDLQTDKPSRRVVTHE